MIVKALDWVQDDGESFAELDGLLMVVWEDEEKWRFQVQRGDDEIREHQRTQTWAYYLAAAPQVVWVVLIGRL